MAKEDKEAKKMVTFRVTPDAKQLLELLTGDMGVSQTAVLETAIRLLARRQKVSIGGSVTPTGNDTTGEGSVNE